MLSFRYIVQPTGGLIYHWRALRYRTTLWRPFQEQIARWLASWRPNETDLLLIGPSGGYTLNHSFLGRFSTVTCIEPDPIAHEIFKNRYLRKLKKHGTRLEWVAADISEGFDPSAIHRLLSRYPKHAVLFSNILGQLHLSVAHDPASENRFALWKDELRRSLGSRSWASYHDRLSGESNQPPHGLEKLSGELSDEKLAQIAFGRNVGEVPVELTDHQTEGLFPGFSRRTYFVWELMPRHYQIIEAVCSDSAH